MERWEFMSKPSSVEAAVEAAISGGIQEEPA